MADEQVAPSRAWLVGAVGLAVLAFVLGVVGLLQHDQASQPASEVVYHALQLFVLGSDPVEDAGVLPVSLEIARILAPATTVYAVFETLRKLWRDDLARRRVSRLSHHSIVCGDDAVSRVLTRNLHHAGTSVVRIAPGVGGACTESRGVSLVRGSARERTTLVAAGIRRASTLYACASGSGDSTAVALAARHLRLHPPPPGRWSALRDRLRGRPPARDARLEVFAQVTNDDLVEALRVRQLGASGGRGASVDFFSVGDTAARVLLTRTAVGKEREVAVVGSGPFTPALLRTLVRTPLPEGVARTVTVHTDAPGSVDELATRFRAAKRGTTLKTVTLGEPIASGTPLIVVCDDTDETTLGTALRLQRSPGWHVVACLSRADPFANALVGTDRLTVFGLLDAACHAEAIAGDAILGRAARAIHRNYVENCRAAGDTPQRNTSMRDWEDLPPHLQESNYAQAEHIGVKLARLPAVLTTTPPDPEFTFRGDEVVELAELEHQRWVEERQAAGFRLGPEHDDTHHPDLVSWDDLSDEARKKDIAAVEQLPSLLRAAGLYITRYDRGDGHADRGVGPARPVEPGT